MISLILLALRRAFILDKRLLDNAASPPKSLFAALILVHCDLTLSDAYTRSNIISFAQSNYLKGNMIIDHWSMFVNEHI